MPNGLKRLKKLKLSLKVAKNTERRLVQFNLVFVFVFLVIWDYANNKQFLNAMSLGLVLFGPTLFLWFLGSFRAISLVVLISIFEFMFLLVFIAEGFELAGFESTLKSIFWIPYLVVAGINGFWALKLYSNIKEKKLVHAR